MFEPEADGTKWTWFGPLSAQNASSTNWRFSLLVVLAVTGACVLTAAPVDDVTFVSVLTVSGMAAGLCAGWPSRPLLGVFLGGMLSSPLAAALLGLWQVVPARSPVQPLLGVCELGCLALGLILLAGAASWQIGCVIVESYRPGKRKTRTKSGAAIPNAAPAELPNAREFRVYGYARALIKRPY